MYTSDLEPIIYPGEFLQETLETLDISIYDLSDQTDIPLYIIKDIIDGIHPINIDIAYRLEHVTNISIHIWLGLEDIFRIKE